MNQSHSESDVSMSPTKILERLQVLRQLQLLQRGKLQKQRLQYQGSPETTSSITEIVSQFSNSTNYNTFRSLLQSSHESSNEGSPCTNTSNLSQKVNEQDLIEGVSVLNLSQESELIIGSHISTKSNISSLSKEDLNVISPLNNSTESKTLAKMQVALDEMPILSPKKDFEALILEKLQNEINAPKAKSPKKKPEIRVQFKKPFLRRGEGMARFGVRKNDLVIQNTKSLPWRRKNLQTQPQESSIKSKEHKNGDKVRVQILVNEQKPAAAKKNVPMKIESVKEKAKTSPEQDKNNESSVQTLESHICEVQADNQLSKKLIKLPKGKHSLLVNKGKTWAAVLTKEQDDFLRELKQSDYYKNFTSPAKSTFSDVSCDEHLSRVRQEREAAEQNMFELIENKVTQENYNLQNSFFNRFLRRSKLEISGESTPLIMQKCLAENPDLMHIFPGMKQKQRNENSHSDVESYEYTENCSETCSSICSQCSCQTVEEAKNSPLKCFRDINNKKNDTGYKSDMNKAKKKEATENEKCQGDTVTQDNIMKANMAEMNAKLIATSDLLKERLCELEDEIETFRKENANLTKLREEIDLERQKFYEDKTVFEQKFNEEKILSEYYLAEEKEKVTKQKQIYEKYVREMRGRLNKKDKDEVQNLKKEINDLKEEIRMKDAKSTSTIARLRNQIKIMEKEKKDLQEEIEKLKKQNRRIQHNNDVTRRLTNIKYLEEINKKLSHISSKAPKSEISVDNDVKYKAYEIERQSRSRKVPSSKNVPRPRAKSVPSLNVTSRYAKYFSQRDAVSQMEKNKTLHKEYLGTYTYPSDNDDSEDDKYENVTLHSDTHLIQDNDMSENEENNLEKIYMERFSSSPQSSRSSLPNFNTGHNLSDRNDCIDNPQGFFISKSSNSSSAKNSISPNPRSISPLPNCSGSNRYKSKSSVSILCNRSNCKSSIVEKDSTEYLPGLSRESNYSKRSKSPISVISNPSSGSQRSSTVINMDNRLTVSPEPSTSKTSMTKTNLNPTEIKKSDGSRELRFPNGNVKHISTDGKYSKFIYYNGDVKETFYNEGRIKYFYAETKTFHTTHADGLEVLEFPDGQIEKRYKDGSTEIRLPNGSVRYFDPKNEHVREEWRFPDGTALTVSASGERRIVFSNGQVEVHAKDHKRREFPDGTVKLVYNDGTAETRYASGRVRVKDKHGNLVMDSAPG